MKRIYKNLITGMAMIGLAGSSSCFATDLTPGATASANKNYIHALIPQTNAGDGGTMIETIQYFDGLGRPYQSVLWQASPSSHDIVTPITYDIFGREYKKYIPYAGTNSNGSYASSDVAGQSGYYTGVYGSTDGDNAFSKTEYEASPINRVLKQGAPGAAWQPNSTPSTDHSVKFGYGTNIANEVKRWKVVNNVMTDDGVYDASTLYKITTWDENNDQTSGSASRTEEFKDLQGKVVLKRSKSGSEILSTFYVYDDLEQLRFVLPPKAMEDNAISGTELNDLCYQYRYDERKRMAMKKLPGADSISLVYDNRDRLVLSQDGTSRAAGKWQFTKYDCFNRPVMTGYFSPYQSAEQLRTAFNGYTGTMYETAQGYGNIGYSFDNSYPSVLTISESNILSVTYYDNYLFLGVTGFSPVSYNSSYDIDNYIDNDGTNDGYFDNVKGSITGTKMKVLDTNEFTGSAKWLYAANYYDDRYRVIQSRRTLYDGSTGGVETLASQYEFTGRLGQTRLAQTYNGVTTTVNKYLTYDPQGRLTKTEQEIAGDSNGRVTVAENVYNEIGQLIDKKLHKVGSSFLQNVDYTYNIRGWLKSINDPDNLSGDLFAEKILYEGIESGLNSGTTAQYNGNISAMVLRSNFKDFKRGYEFTYDGLNRLGKGDFKSYNGVWIDSTSYEERSIAYDLNGNITNLQRTDGSGGDIANFAYSYNGNQLNYIANNGTAYSYDLNGNTTLDGLRGMAIGYNVLNLPKKISKGSDSIKYIYTANGEKLAKRDKSNLYQYYAGSMIYNNDKSLNYILFEEGMVNKSSGAFTYEYHLKDHLGNTRVTFQPNGGGTTTTQVAEYYPFGSSYLPVSPAGTNKYLYNGKEKQDDVLSGTALDVFDYGARFYDPVILRWTTMDPLVEKHQNYTPYAYVYNNPIKLIDPLGLDSVYVLDQASRPNDNGKAGKTYTADVFVVKDGSITGPYCGSSYPNSVSNSDNSPAANTVNEGDYPFNNESGHKGGTEKGLNVVDTGGNRKVPGTDTKGNDVTMTDVNVHKGKSDQGNSNSRGSLGCITINPSESESFFSNFSWNNTSKTTGISNGEIFIQRGTSADAMKQRLTDQQDWQRNPLRTLEPKVGVVSVTN